MMMVNLMDDGDEYDCDGGGCSKLRRWTVVKDGMTTTDVMSIMSTYVIDVFNMVLLLVLGFKATHGLDVYLNKVASLERTLKVQGDTLTRASHSTFQGNCVYSCVSVSTGLHTCEKTFLVLMYLMTILGALSSAGIMLRMYFEIHLPLPTMITVCIMWLFNISLGIFPPILLALLIMFSHFSSDLLNVEEHYCTYIKEAINKKAMRQRYNDTVVLICSMATLGHLFAPYPYP